MTDEIRQIEAVEDVLRGLVIISGDSTWDMNYVAKAALTAAAEVGEPRPPGGLKPIKQDAYFKSYLRTEIAATIERCAGVVK